MPADYQPQIYRDEDWEHGLRCGECSTLFTKGMPIAEQFNGLIDDIPCVTPVCIPCGLATPVAHSVCEP